MNREFLVQLMVVSNQCQLVFDAANCLPNTPEAIERATDLYDKRLVPFMNTYIAMLRDGSYLQHVDQSIVNELIEERYTDGTFKFRHYRVIRGLLLERLGAIIDLIFGAIHILDGELKDRVYKLRTDYVRFKRNWNM
jgi:hypothetical protein